MSTAILDREQTTPEPAELLTGDIRVTQGRVIRSEFSKLLSLRSVWGIIALLNLTILVVGIQQFWGQMSSYVAYGGAPAFVDYWDLNSVLILTMILASAIGITAICSEFGSGSIRTTLTAVPERMPVFLAKLAVVAVVTLAATLPALLIVWGASAWIALHFGATGFALGAGLIAVLLSAAFMTMLAAMSFAIGSIIRSSAAALVVMFGLLYGLPLILNGIFNASNNPTRYTMLGVSSAVSSLSSTGGQLRFAMGVMIVLTAVSVGVAAIIFKRRNV